MSNTNVIQNSYTSFKLSTKASTLVTTLAIALAVLLPQLAHLMGAALGLNTMLGEVILPMHLPVMLTGFIAGPIAGTITGLFAPIISYALTGMPGVAMLPFIIVELSIYGLTSGALKKTNLHIVAKVFVIQLSGRLVRALAILATFYLAGIETIKPAIIWTSIKTGAVGIVLQLILIPLIMLAVGKVINNEGYSK